MYNLKKLTSNTVGSTVFNTSPLVTARYINTEIIDNVQHMNYEIQYCPYIRNGLAVWLDGIYKGNSSGNWVDLIGGKVFTNTGCTARDNHWYFNNTYQTNATCYFTNNDTMNYPSATCTLEIVYDAEFDNYFCAFITKHSGSVGFGSNTNGNGYVVTVYTARNSFTRTIGPERGIFTVVNNQMYRNGESLTTSGTSRWATVPSTNAIGYSPGAPTWSFKGKIYCIRIYDRQLTENEIIFNHKLDNARFKLGLENTNPSIQYTPMR